MTDFQKLADERVEELLAMEAASEMQLASNYRKRVIEECARLCEDRRWGVHTPLETIAAAIRALKEKP